MKNLLVTLAVCALLPLTSCSDKPEQVPCAEVTNNFSLKAFSRRNAPPMYIYNTTLANSTTTSNNLPIGGLFRISDSRAFVYPDGRTATGQIQLRYRAITDRAQMVLSNAPTVTTTGELLESAGEFYIQALQDGQALRLRQGSGLSFFTPPTNRVSAASAANMQLFIGDTTQTPGLAWVLNPATDSASRVQAIPVQATPQSNMYMYSVGLWPNSLSNPNLGNLGWINCDAFWNDPAPRVRVTVTVPAAVVNDPNTRVYLVFRSRNSVMSLYQQNGNSEYEVSNVPAGQQVTAVVLRTDGQSYYYGEQTATSGANQSFNVPLQAMSESDIVAKVNLFR